MITKAGREEEEEEEEEEGRRRIFLFQRFVSTILYRDNGKIFSPLSRANDD